MTIISIPPNDRVETFTASADQVLFSFDFPIYDPAHLDVRRVRAGAETPLSYPTDYTVAGAGTQGGGTITLAAGAMAGDTIQIGSAQPTERRTNFAGNGDLRAESLNAEFNRLWITLQQQDRGQSVLAGLPPASGRGNTLLGFDDEGVLTLYPVNEAGVITGPPGPRGPVGQGAPLGSLVFYDADTIPLGWTEADGKAISRTVYAEYFGRVGTRYGAGNGSTTFNVRDMRGRLPLGLDTMGGTAAGRVTVGVSGIAADTMGAAGGDQRLQLHGHGVNNPPHAHGASASAAGGTAVGGGSVTLPTLTVSDALETERGLAPGEITGSTPITISGASIPDHAHIITVGPAATEISVNPAGAGGSQNMPPVSVGRWIVCIERVGEGGTVPDHTHAIENITGLQSALDGKAPLTQPVLIVAGATYAPPLAANGAFARCTNAGGCTITLPSDATTAFPIGGDIAFSQASATSLTFVAGSGATLNVASTHLAATNVQHAVVQVKKLAANTWIIYGNLRLA